MPDVFLSYSREDQVVARHFAEGLEREGFSVWWDQTLRSGEAYDRVTEKALREAKAVVVLWSKHSVESRWVRAEATSADRRGTLVPAMIENCDRPIMFELTHTAELPHWRGDARDPAWRAYVEDVRRFVQRALPAEKSADAAVAPAVTAHTESAPRRGRLEGKWIAVIATVSILALAAVFVLPRLHRAPAIAAADAKVSVAVMPFANVTGDPGKDYIGDGIAEELINALIKVPGLTVPSRTSSFAYKGRNVDLKQVAADLGVDSVLEGSVRVVGERVRVIAQLIDAKSDRNLWSQTYERTTTDLFALQDDLAREIVAEFRKTRNAQLPELQSAPPPTSDPEAYALYLQGAAAVNRNSSTSLADAIAAFDKAVTRDPKFGGAYLGRATGKYLYGSPLEEVERDAGQAMEIQPNLTPSVRRLLAGVAARRGRWTEAEEVFRSSSTSSTVGDPVNPGLRTEHALSTLWPMGHLKEVVEAYEQAYRDAPAAGSIVLVLGMARAAVGRDAEAIGNANTAIELGVDPNSRRVLQLYADIAARQGRYADAVERMVSSLPTGVRAAGGEAAVRQVYAALADRSKSAAAIAALRKVESSRKAEEWVFTVWSMNWASQLGANDYAYALAEELRQQFAQQSPTNGWAWLWSPELRNFRLDPRFHEFTSRLGMFDFWKKYGPPDGCSMETGRLVCR